ncbi:type II secretion system minor pseudopilin GspK [Noviherbaspirillum aerium]|uniref:type II secretion system minor pseudopilin GspK n=1 Tax=Noviherbaspirillum aerium TaxID=2588497 RepID=UPI00124CC648|nr:type II secretion system minor pseudopilin GspK [Noviherbaspirillum aerium]
MHSRERGVAVVTALLLTTLAITIVASLFWQQQVQVRSIENQRLQMQKQWILRGAIDYARLILMADTRKDVDGLDEPWAVPLAETRLDDYVENGRSGSDVPDAVLSGGIEDAQARFNLAGMCCTNNQPDAKKVAAFARLLSALQLNASLAQATANYLVSSRAAGNTVGTLNPDPGSAANGGGGATGANPAAGAGANPGGQISSTAGQRSLNLVHVDDLLAVPGFTPEIVEKLRPYLIVLDDANTININTASAEVIHAAIDTLSISDARAIVMARRNASFRSSSDAALVAVLGQKTLGAGAGFQTNYFLINGKVRLNRAGMQMQALINRKQQSNTPGVGQGSSQVIWIREF